MSEPQTFINQLFLSNLNLNPNLQNKWFYWTYAYTFDKLEPKPERNFSNKFVEPQFEPEQHRLGFLKLKQEIFYILRKSGYARAVVSSLWVATQNGVALTFPEVAINYHIQFITDKRLILLCSGSQTLLVFRSAACYLVSQ